MNLPNIAETIVDEKKRPTRNFSEFLRGLHNLIFIRGVSATVVTAKITGGGTNGSMTFTNGVLTSQTPAT